MLACFPQATFSNIKISWRHLQWPLPLHPLPLFIPPLCHSSTMSASDRQHCDPATLVTGQKCAHPNTLELGPRKRPFVFLSMVQAGPHLLLEPLRILWFTMVIISDRLCTRSVTSRPLSPMVCVTIFFLSHVFFLVSIIQYPYFHFAPSHEETHHYLLTFPSYSSFIIPL